MEAFEEQITELRLPLRNATFRCRCCRLFLLAFEPCIYSPCINKKNKIKNKKDSVSSGYSRLKMQPAVWQHASQFISEARCFYKLFFFIIISFFVCLLFNYILQPLRQKHILLFWKKTLQQKKKHLYYHYYFIDLKCT